MQLSVYLRHGKKTHRINLHLLKNHHARILHLGCFTPYKLIEIRSLFYKIFTTLQMFANNI